MMNRTAAAARSVILVLSTIASVVTACAADVQLMNGVVPGQGANPQTKPDQFRKKGPWRIGMSHFGVGNTWTFQMAHDAQSEAASNPEISQFLFRNANLSATKQAADIDDLIAQGVDALIVTPLTPTSAEAGIQKAIARGIPVIVHTGLTANDDYTVEIAGGGTYFGRVMGDFLAKELGGKGNIWALRGVPSHPEEVRRYQGLLDAIKGTNIKIVAQGYGSWEYSSARKLCEIFYQRNPDVQGIWSSGADMSRACVDVFRQHGAKIPPITGEGNNGFFKEWRDDKLTAIAPEYGPEQGAAAVRAAVYLLEGKQLYKHYIYNPPPITAATRDGYLRDDLSDAYWFPTALPEEQKKKYYALRH